MTQPMLTKREGLLLWAILNEAIDSILSINDENARDFDDDDHMLVICGHECEPFTPDEVESLIEKIRPTVEEVPVVPNYMSHCQRLVDELMGGDYWPADRIRNKLVEEMGEFFRAYRPGRASDDNAQEELGDMLFGIICYANREGWNLDTLLERVMQKHRVNVAEGRPGSQHYTEPEGRPLTPPEIIDAPFDLVPSVSNPLKAGMRGRMTRKDSHAEYDGVVINGSRGLAFQVDGMLSPQPLEYFKQFRMTDTPDEPDPEEHVTSEGRTIEPPFNTEPINGGPIRAGMYCVGVHKETGAHMAGQILYGRSGFEFHPQPLLSGGCQPPVAIKLKKFAAFHVTPDKELTS